MTSVTFEDYDPPPRYTPEVLPWNRVEIQESATGVGPGTLIDTIVFLDLDPDAEAPKQRSFTTDNATLENAYYRVRFLDADNDATNWSAYVQNVLVTDPSWQPTIRQVAELLHSRTKDQFGNYLGTFTSNTDPTSTRVAHLINVAQDNVISDLGGNPTDPATQGKARHLVQLYTAMLIELGHYSEQVTRDISPYKELKKLYDSELAILLPDDDTGVAPGDATTVIDSQGNPTYFFEGFAVGKRPW